MQRSPRWMVAPAVIMLLLAVSAASGQALFTSTVVGSGFARPVYVGAPPGDMERIFVVEQWEARIRIIKNGTLLATPFLDLPTSTVIASGNERGLLGLAFDPNYWSNGFFYLNYNNPSGHTVIARYTVSANPDIANTTATVLQMTPGITTYSYAQPFSNHNGGWIGFGPDGYLYIGSGDGGSANDPQGNGQNINVLLGKMLRVDPRGTVAPFYTNPPTNPFFGAIAGRDEIWAFGLRNPWRNSFDRVTGALYIGDVGQNAWEEIDYQPPFDSANPSATAGRNYGWVCREGNATFSGCNPPNMINPIHVYSHSVGCSVTGGYVYRGCAIPSLIGTYLFSDYCSSQIYSFTYPGTGTIPTAGNLTAQLTPPGFPFSSISSFGEDGLGEVYFCDHSAGRVYKIIPTVANTQTATITLGGPPTLGTTLNLNLSSPQDGGRGYVCALSLGIDPAIRLADGRQILLAPDPILALTLDPLSPVMVNHYGTLSATGTATVGVILPNDPLLANIRLVAAFVALNTTSPSGISKISCPRPFVLQ